MAGRRRRRRGDHAEESDQQCLVRIRRRRGVACAHSTIGRRVAALPDHCTARAGLCDLVRYAANDAPAHRESTRSSQRIRGGNACVSTTSGAGAASAVRRGRGGRYLLTGL